jgi:hypothetical protein
MKRYVGNLLIAIAVVLLVFPRYADCESQGRSLQLANGAAAPMKCHWSGIAEEALAIPLAVVGALLVLRPKEEDGAVLAVVGIALGLVIILIPTYLIGVCPTLTMVCHTLMLPTLVLLGALVALASAALLFFRGRRGTAQ